MVEHLNILLYLLTLHTALLSCSTEANMVYSPPKKWSGAGAVGQCTALAFHVPGSEFNPQHLKRKRNDPSVSTTLQANCLALASSPSMMENTRTFKCKSPFSNFLVFSYKIFFRTTKTKLQKWFSDSLSQSLSAEWLLSFALQLCYSLDLEWPSKAHVWRAWSPAHMALWEVPMPLGGGTEWEQVRTLSVYPRREYQTPVPISFSLLLPGCHEVNTPPSFMSAVMYSAATGPKGRSSVTMDWNLRNHEPQYIFPPYKLFVSVFCYGNGK